MPRYSKKSQEDVREKMHEMKRGELHSGGSGKKVTNPRQAIAIGLSDARKEGAKVPPPPNEKTSRGSKTSRRSGRKRGSHTR